MPKQIQVLVKTATTMDGRTGMVEEGLAQLQAGHAREGTG
jgi:riboflavin biosynthesis pyrimidine reductase